MHQLSTVFWAVSRPWTVCYLQVLGSKLIQCHHHQIKFYIFHSTQELFNLWRLWKIVCALAQVAMLLMLTRKDMKVYSWRRLQQYGGANGAIRSSTACYYSHYQEGEVPHCSCGLFLALKDIRKIPIFINCLQKVSHQSCWLVIFFFSYKHLFFSFFYVSMKKT